MSTKYNFINDALITQILQHLRNGEVQRCLEMGLDIDSLNVLHNNPAALSVLRNSPSRWSDVKVDLDIVKRLLDTVERTEQEVRMIHRALRLGATTKMMQDFFGLTQREVVLQRRLADAPGRAGRHRDLENTNQIWHRFVSLMKDNGYEHSDAVALLDVCMMITEEENAAAGTDLSSPEYISLGLIWNLIQVWISDGLYPPKPFKASLTLISTARRTSRSAIPNPDEGPSPQRTDNESASSDVSPLQLDAFKPAEGDGSR